MAGTTNIDTMNPRQVASNIKQAVTQAGRGFKAMGIEPEDFPEWLQNLELLCERLTALNAAGTGTGRGPGRPPGTHAANGGHARSGARQTVGAH